MSTLEDTVGRRDFLLGAAGFLVASSAGLLLPSTAHASLPISDDLSPKNSGRKHRPHTEYIVLHTTEAPDVSSLNMVKQHGLAHYLVHTNGRVKRIIDKYRVARHAGRSMWEGRTNLDNWAIGIEVVGYHDTPITAVQCHSLKELLDELQGAYGIPDNHVVPHSMVAYGAPNRWLPYDHRGRKRCGMFFATPATRKKLGLGSAPTYDLDVRAGRLVIADAYLNDILFGSQVPGEIVGDERISVASVGNTITETVSAWQIARDNYNAPTTQYTFPGGTVALGHEINNWGQLPLGTTVDMNVGEAAPDDIEYFERITGNDTAWDVVGPTFNAPTTIYFFPDRTVRTGDELSAYTLNHIPGDTEVLTGYVYGGHVTSRRSASDIAGTKWNDPSTFYRFPSGKIVSGDDIDPRQIPRETLLFFRNGV